VLWQKIQERIKRVAGSVSKVLPQSRRLTFDGQILPSFRNNKPNSQFSLKEATKFSISPQPDIKRESV
jgi:hypothetical protein